MMDRFSFRACVAVCLVVGLGVAFGCRGSGCGEDGVSRDGPQLEYAIEWEDAIRRQLRAHGRRLSHSIRERRPDADVDVSVEQGLIVRTSGPEVTALVEEVAGEQVRDLEVTGRNDHRLIFELSESAADTYRASVGTGLVRSIRRRLHRADIETPST